MAVMVTSPWCEDVMKWQYMIHTFSLERETLEREPILAVSYRVSTRQPL